MAWDAKKEIGTRENRRNYLMYTVDLALRMAANGDESVRPSIAHLQGEIQHLTNEIDHIRLFGTLEGFSE